MTIREIHAEIKKIVPAAGVVQVQHTYINNVCGEHFGAMVFEKEDEDTSIIHVCMEKTPSKLLKAVKEKYELYLKTKPSKAGKIAKLRLQIAKLEGKL